MLQAAVTIVGTIACAVLVVVLWPRLSDRGPRRAAAFVGMLLSVSVLVVLTGVVAYNAQRSFGTERAGDSAATAGMTGR